MIIEEKQKIMLKLSPQTYSDLKSSYHLLSKIELKAEIYKRKPVLCDPLVSEMLKCEFPVFPSAFFEVNPSPVNVSLSLDLTDHME